MRVAQVHQMTVRLPIQRRNGVGDVTAKTVALTPALVRRTKQAVARQQLVTVHWVRQRAAVPQDHVQADTLEAVITPVITAHGVRTAIAVPSVAAAHVQAQQVVQCLIIAVVITQATLVTTSVVAARSIQ